MLSIKGIYDGEKVILLEPVPTKKQLNAIITLFDSNELATSTVSVSPSPVTRPATADGEAAMYQLCQGLGKGPEDLANNHDYYLFRTSIAP